MVVDPSAQVPDRECPNVANYEGVETDPAVGDMPTKNKLPEFSNGRQIRRLSRCKIRSLDAIQLSIQSTQPRAFFFIIVPPFINCFITFNFFFSFSSFDFFGTSISALQTGGKQRHGIDTFGQRQDTFPIGSGHRTGRALSESSPVFALRPRTSNPFFSGRFGIGAEVVQK